MNDPGRYILLAEDDKVVAELIRHALLDHDPDVRIVHVRDGVETLDYLYARERYARRDNAPPAVVLLDVKMPRLDGLEVLRQVKGDERLRSIPVVMLTSSQDERDIRDSYAFGANAYVVKPVEFRRFTAMLKQIEIFWMKINQPPLLDASASVSSKPHAA